MKKLFFFALLIGTICFVQSCKDKSEIEDFQVDFGYEYLPLEIGKYRDYKVDSTTYDIGPTGSIIVTNSTTYIRELVADTIIDNLGRPGFTIERYKKEDLEAAWEIKDIWMTIQTATQVESLEENLRFIKMIFPLKAGTVWDGNRFIDETTTVTVAGETVEIFKAWEYEVDFVGEPVAVNNEFYEDAVQIIQADNENLIELRYAKEQYVKDIGLVYKEMRILDTQCISDCEGFQWEEKAEKGFILVQSLIDHN